MRRKGLIGLTWALAAALGVLAATLPAAGATTQTFSGVVLAKNAQRHALVVASTTGVVRTIHVRSLRERVGTRVAVQAIRLRNGGFRTLRISIGGLAKQAMIKNAVVVRQRLSRVIVSAGGSLFSIYWAGRTLAAAGSSTPLSPGTVIDATVTISSGGDLDAESVDEVQAGPTGTTGATGTTGPTGSDANDQGENDDGCVATGATVPTSTAGDDQAENDDSCAPTGTTVTTTAPTTTAGDDQGENEDSCAPTGTTVTTTAPTTTAGDDQGENDNGCVTTGSTNNDSGDGNSSGDGGDDGGGD